MSNTHLAPNKTTGLCKRLHSSLLQTLRVDYALWCRYRFKLAVNLHSEGSAGFIHRNEYVDENVSKVASQINYRPFRRQSEARCELTCPVDINNAAPRKFRHVGIESLDVIDQYPQRGRIKYTQVAAKLLHLVSAKVPGLHQVQCESKVDQLSSNCAFRPLKGGACSSVTCAPSIHLWGKADPEGHDCSHECCYRRRPRRCVRRLQIASSKNERCRTGAKQNSNDPNSYGTCKNGHSFIPLSTMDHFGMARHLTERAP